MDSRAYTGTDLFDVMRRAMRGSAVRDPSDAIERKDECDIVRNRLGRLEREIERLEDRAKDASREVERMRRDRRASLTEAAIAGLSTVGGALTVVLRSARAARAAARSRKLSDLGVALLTIAPPLAAAHGVLGAINDTREIRDLMRELAFLENQADAVTRAADRIQDEGRRLGCVL